MSFTFRNFDSLSPHDIKGNCKKAFDAGDRLGIPRVIEPSDMHMLAGKSTLLYLMKHVLQRISTEFLKDFI